MSKMTPIEKHYYELSEIYLSAYQNNTEHNYKIMQAMGVIVEMESDLIVFERKNKQTAKSKHQQDRINVLKLAVDSFTIATERNLQFNMIMGRLYKDNQLQILKIAELEKEIDKLTKNLNGL